MAAEVKHRVPPLEQASTDQKDPNAMCKSRAPQPTLFPQICGDESFIEGEDDDPEALVGNRNGQEGMHHREEEGGEDDAFQFRYPQ